MNRIFVPLYLSLGLAISLSWPLSSLGEEINGQRALFNYQMFCQGCHTADGSGFNSIPQMKNHVGNFLKTAKGRDYLVRVPGSATSSLNNEQLAEVLNWILVEFSGESLAPNYRPYTSSEVGRLRLSPLSEVERYRAQLLENIADTRVVNSYNQTIVE